MNNINQKKKLERQLLLYKAFSVECGTKSFPKLLSEMVYLADKIECIRCMNLDQLLKEVDIYYIKKPSKMNVTSV